MLAQLVLCSILGFLSSLILSVPSVATEDQKIVILTNYMNDRAVPQNSRKVTKGLLKSTDLGAWSLKSKQDDSL